jgi:hypothetical protein
LTFSPTVHAVGQICPHEKYCKQFFRDPPQQALTFSDPVSKLHNFRVDLPSGKLILNMIVCQGFSTISKNFKPSFSLG